MFKVMTLEIENINGGITTIEKCTSIRIDIRNGYIHIWTSMGDMKKFPLKDTLIREAGIVKSGLILYGPHELIKELTNKEKSKMEKE